MWPSNHFKILNSGDNEEDENYYDEFEDDERSRNQRDLDFFKKFKISFKDRLNALIALQDHSKESFVRIKKLDTEYTFLNWTYFFHEAFKFIGEDAIINDSLEVLVQVRCL